MTVFMLLAGSYHGGWCWRGVSRGLERAGAEVFCPTLSGLGEREHLYHPGIGLGTHVEDVTRTIEVEDLDAVTLVAHSYAGMVAGMVVDRVLPRIERVIYFDAFVPEDGKSCMDLMPTEIADAFTQSVAPDGRVPLTESALDRWGLDDPVQRAWVRSRATDHPLKTLTDAAVLGRPVIEAAPVSHYIHCTRKPTGDPFQRFSEAAVRDTRWQFRELDATHEYMITHTSHTVATLLECANAG